MSEERAVEITEADLTRLRSAPDAVEVVTSLLGINEMKPSEQVRTREEVRDWLESGQVDEGRLIIRNAARRRERWQRELDESEFAPGPYTV
jgi:hypothetical protein